MMNAFSTTQPLSIAGAAGQIEAVFDPAETAPQHTLAVICHPLPTGGGTMSNKVVTMLGRALREMGVDTLRFNFRGVGASEGVFDDGRGELDDLRAVVAWARAQFPDKTLWLAGFSFGSWVSLRACEEVQAKALISIAPPVGRSWNFSELVLPSVPWLVVQGDADEIVDAQAVYAWIETLPKPPQLVRMPDTSHFFHRKLMDLREAVQREVQPWLPHPVSA